MDTEELNEEIEDLVYSLEVNKEIIIDEITKYYIYYQYYYKNIVSNIDPNNYTYLYRKLMNLNLSTNQLIYEASTEYMFWDSFIKLTDNPNFINIYEDIADEIEDIMIIFTDRAYYRSMFFDEYKEVFDKYLKNHLIIDDTYFLSDVDKNDYTNLLNKYNNKLLKTKK